MLFIGGSSPETVNFKPKQDVVKQEVDRNEDMIQSALRAVASLNRISGGDCSQRSIF
ncbi:hypothetical protein Lser_V15G29036 [Lactuca serriola]